jgi:hypothetical protein
VTFTDLQEFSNYRIIVTATFDAFGTDDAVVAMADFSTPSASKLIYFVICSTKDIGSIEVLSFPMFAERLCKI